MGSVSRRAAKKKRHAWRKNPVGAWIRSRRVPDTASVRARPPRTARTPCPLERTPMTSTLSPQERYLAARRRARLALVKIRPTKEECSVCFEDKILGTVTCGTNKCKFCYGCCIEMTKEMVRQGGANGHRMYQFTDTRAMYHPSCPLCRQPFGRGVWPPYGGPSGDKDLVHVRCSFGVLLPPRQRPPSGRFVRPQ